MADDEKNINSSSRRAGSFKFNSLTPEELRRRRQENQVEIRKSKRDDSITKRRTVNKDAVAAIAAANSLSPAPTGFPGAAGSSTSTIDTTTSNATNNTPLIPSRVKMTNAEFVSVLPQWVQYLASTELETQLLVTTEFRKILSKDKEPPISETVDAGIVERFVHLLSMYNQKVLELHGVSADQLGKEDEILLTKMEKIQFESSWVLTNIASGEPQHTLSVVQAGAVPVMVKMLQHPNAEIREQCIWALGNISGDGTELRNFVVDNGAIPLLLENLTWAINNDWSPISIIRNAIWALSNFCRGTPPLPTWDPIFPILPFFPPLLSTTDECRIDACWATSYLTSGSDPIILNAIIAAGIVPPLVNLLLSGLPNLQVPALRALGNIVTGDDQQTQAVIDADVLGAFRVILSDIHVKNSLRKECCWAVSNIAAGTAMQCQAIIDANLIPRIIRYLESGEIRVKKECCWVVCNVSSHYKIAPNLVTALVEANCIPPLISLLSSDGAGGAAAHDEKTIAVALDALSNILTVGEMLAEDALLKGTSTTSSVNPYASIVEELEGIDVICDLQSHSSNDVYLKSKNIIDSFFGGLDEEEEALLASGIYDDDDDNGFHQDDKDSFDRIFSNPTGESNVMNEEFNF